MNQVELGLVCGSMRAFRSIASSAIVPRASLWMTWDDTPLVPGPPLRR
jgi:hypothetical protein